MFTAFRRVLRVLTLSVTGALVATLTATAAPATAATAPPPPIGGYFVYTASSQSATRTMLDDIRATGATTLVTFGTRLKPVGVRDGRPDDPAFADCRSYGAGCVAVAGVPVRYVLTYSEMSQWAVNAGTLKCRHDRVITTNGKRYTVFYIPIDNNGCTGSKYDVVVSLDTADPASDRTKHLVTLASERGMKVFLGLPAPVQRTDQAWLPNTAYLPTLEKFTERWVANQKRFGASSSSVVGFYHHTEMPLRYNDHWKPVLDTYAAQNRAVARVQPGARTLVSPYIDARRNSAQRIELSTVAGAVRSIISTSSGTRMTIAPQDGQGTGKVGAFTPAQANTRIDAPSRPVAGDTTYAKAYLGSTGDYMRQVVAGAGTSADVWVNIELMTATTSGAPTCDGASLGRGRAGIDRVRQQYAVGKVAGVSGSIGFMWSPFATCGGKDSLAQALRR